MTWKWITNLADSIKAMTKISPTVFDGLVYLALGWFIYAQSYLGGDDAAKYINPAPLFWLNFAVGSGATIAGALKMFRSTAYADYKNKQSTGNTEVFTKQTETPK